MLHERDGAIQGIRAYGIRRVSLAGRFGYQKGDIIERVNGESMSNATGALRAFDSLSTAPVVTVDLERRGTHLRFVYRVVDGINATRADEPGGEH